MDRARRNQRGLAAVELGLLLVPLITLVFGVSEYGRAMYQYNTLAKAVRTGARYLSQYQAGDAASIGIAKCLVVHATADCSGDPVALGLTKDMVSVVDASTDNRLKLQPVTANGVTVGVTNLVRVRVVGYQFVPVVTFVMNNALTFDPISVTMTQALP